MVAGLLMVILPNVIFLATLPVSGRLAPLLRWLYRIVGGAIVIAGSIVTLYLAAYTGDQGGIAAFFFQIAVIAVYVFFSVLLVSIHLLARGEAKKRHQS